MQNSGPKHIQVATLRDTILDDIFKDFTHSSKKWVRTTLEPLVWFSAHQFAGMLAKFDITTAHYGFKQALKEFLSPLVHSVELSGHENIPKDGPLLIVSNHPGVFDSIAIGASLTRDDLSIVATGFPLLRKLPYASQSLIYVDPHAPMNITGVRSTIDHLEAGGAVLIFPSGRVEPDPAIFPLAQHTLQNWSRSIELFLRKVPETRVMVTIVSRVMDPIFLHNPLIRLLRGVRDPLMVAEVTQVVTQMVLKKCFRMKPKISFDLPRTLEELQCETGNAFQTILSRAGRIMMNHLPAVQRYPMQKKV